MPSVDVLESTMYYEQLGDGTPFVFLHGNPTSSHLWRNVLPAIDGPVRRLAPDLIGMGRSGKPDIPYHYDDHARHLDAWFDALDLDDVVLVGIDWGGSLAFDWAARHSERVRGIAFMESIVRPMAWSEFPEAARTRFQAFRTPGVGERMALEENAFMEGALTSTTLAPLSDADLAAYRSPYPTPDSRVPLLEWPRAWPVDGSPAGVTARFDAFDAWLATSDDVPKLLLRFDGSATLLMDDAMVAWCTDNVAALEVVRCGPAGHMAPEDRPGEIAAAVNAWTARHGLR
jgi:haloalkane dehalogenase